MTFAMQFEYSKRNNFLSKRDVCYFPEIENHIWCFEKKATLVLVTTWGIKKIIPQYNIAPYFYLFEYYLLKTEKKSMLFKKFTFI